MGPSAVLLTRRLRRRRCQAPGGAISPSQLLAETIAPVGDERLTQAIARAATIDDANGLILASPQFQRR